MEESRGSGTKRAGGDIRDIDPEALGALFDDIEAAVLSDENAASVGSPASQAEELAELVMSFERVHVSETYSPPRFTAQAPFEGLSAGAAFDLESGWDLSDPEQFQAARQQAEEEALKEKEDAEDAARCQLRPRDRR